MEEIERLRNLVKNLEELNKKREESIELQQEIIFNLENVNKRNEMIIYELKEYIRILKSLWTRSKNSRRRTNA